MAVDRDWGGGGWGSGDRSVVVNPQSWAGGELHARAELHSGGAMTAGLRRSWFGLAVLFAVAACQGKQRTELVVEVDSNLAVPSQMDNVQVAVTANGKTRSLPCSLQGDCKLPWDVGIVEATSGAGIIEIVATGYLATTAIVNQAADLSFVEGKSMLLKLFLARECIGSTCDRNRADLWQRRQLSEQGACPVRI